MKVNKIGNYTIKNTNFASRMPVFRYNAVDSFISMEDKFISAEVDLVRALSKKNPKLNKALKNMNIPKYDIPLLKTLLINPAFDDERVYENIPRMISTKWAWEDKNRACAIGRKDIADLYKELKI